MPPFAEPKAAVAPAPVPAAVIGTSVQGRPIEMYSFGNVEGGTRPVLVMGAIHGNEPTSEDVARGLLAELQRDRNLVSGVPVVIIPVANPDGLALKTRGNVNNVDLNRNFPAKNWGQAATSSTHSARHFENRAWTSLKSSPLPTAA